MKLKYLLSCSIILLSIFNVGCKKFLEETPYSFVATDNFYKTATDAELALTGVYDVLNASTIQGEGGSSTWGRGMQFLTSMGCDELITDATKITSDNNFVTIANYTYTSENTILRSSWFFLYAGITRANFIIERVPAIAMNETRKKQILAEAHFLRGMYYAYLGWLFGGVPVVNSTNVNLNQERSTLKEVMSQVESDFKVAYQDLPNRNPKVGRVNKYTAAGFLVKLYVYLASCKENSVGEALNFPLNSFGWVDKDKFYAEALTICQDIYTQSGYSLIPSFNHLFLSATEETARNEQMMLVQAGAGGNNEYIYYFNLAGPTGNYLTVGGTAGWMRPMREAYTRFNVNDSRRNLSFSGNIAAAATSQVINGRKYFTPTTVSASLSNICLNKWREDDPVDRAARGIPANSGETDYGILRYADVLLMYAECKYKAGDEPGARALLKEVRTRGNTPANLNTITTAYFKANFMDELIDERSRELLGEGWRRFDLIRFGKLKDVVAALNTSITFPTVNVTAVKDNFKDYKIWYPIPRRELDTNKELIPNPGYTN
ncbi:RagB/SusD family nutrient uptake outer membrane protein [Pedobacter hiemivivus]|uniref:RagB/SusD family nutrient uptake outer membrane protein n=1 Tax=Pedobacter hiemivivus TaxID=2530454 RepID=A0A4U1GDD9_9SPHI|nr:RagB/SusD family nutrient uptake outer membrane protein [Pedobacter hiemivivus]TKC62037.1 RagB/SusD family nutrient uptake outer membrane protein [Pedobacter hiemivivus]